MHKSDDSSSKFPGRRVFKRVLRITIILVLPYLAFTAFVYLRQRSLLFFPSHQPPVTNLTPWLDGTHLVGYCREAPHPETIWLMTHGNAGQAANREYVLSCMSPRDSLYVLEYPGYGSRPGSPSLPSFNQAAAEAYRLLRSRHPHLPVCALGESLGSGPACSLAGEKTPPDKIVLVVPFDTLANVASEKLPILPVRWMLRDAWDNVAALKHYRGPVEIFAAEADEVIPPRHARALAAHIPQARLVIVPGGHDDWSRSGQVKIERAKESISSSDRSK